MIANNDKNSLNIQDKQRIAIGEGILEGILGLDDDEEQWALDKINASAIVSVDQFGASASQRYPIDATNQNGVCRLCLLKTNRFDKMFKTPGYKLQPNGKRLMTRMDSFQSKILQTEFDRNSFWSQEKVQALAARLCIPKAKVYKWNWD